MTRQRHLWINVLQAELARLSTQGRQVVVPDSGHMIPFERPDSVVTAIREVLQALQSKMGERQLPKTRLY